ncbi:MAG: proteasome-type protease [Methylophaga sp.]|nr:proteasome-type protease [Methylophaga sp.]
MTYCLAINLDEGLVLTSDSRTNAGIDQVSVYSKMTRCETHADRSLVLMSAGNLATTQFVIEQLNRDIREGQPHNLNTLSYMSDTADYVGEILSSRIRRYSDNEASGFAPEATLLLAGQIQGSPPQAFMIYPQGNHITTSRETPYLQIGESKYGKPVLDRFIRPETSLLDAATCSLISMDSTMQSNVSVGPPIEVLIYKKDSYDLSYHQRFEAEHPYLVELRRAWGQRLREAFMEMPRLDAQQ